MNGAIFVPCLDVPSHLSYVRRVSDATPWTYCCSSTALLLFNSLQK